MAQMALVLTYEYVSDVLERRAPHRDAHLALIQQWSEDGPLAVGGALGDPPHGALIAFETEDRAKVEEFVDADPYVAAGLVSKYTIEPWAIVAARPLAGEP
jgi:uncharacterized protein YciI